MATPRFPSVDASGKIRDSHIPDRLSEDALTQKITAQAGLPAGIVGVVSETPPDATEIMGTPVVWFKSVQNFIPEITTLHGSADGNAATVTFAVVDPDGDPVTVSVDWGDGTVDSDVQSPATHTYAVAGEHTVTVTAEDSWGAVAHRSVVIFIAANIRDRWAYDSFTYPDGTTLASWATGNVPLTTEVGDLTWRPGDQSTGGAQVSQRAHASGGRFTEGSGSSSPSTAIGVATLHLPDASMRTSFRYRITPDNERNSFSRVGLYLACTPVAARGDRNTTSLAIRLIDGLTLKVYTQVDGSFTEIDTVIGIPRAGFLEAAYNAATGQVEIRIDGAPVWSGVYISPAHAKMGIDVRATAWIDDFQVGPL